VELPRSAAEAAMAAIVFGTKRMSVIPPVSGP
jgi:hypothetical protein